MDHDKLQGYEPCKLLKFFVYNPVNFGKTEETEEEKVFYYWPANTDMQVQMSDIGLCEALSTFATEFTTEPTSSCRTDKESFLLIQPEPGWWVVMILQNPRLVSVKEDGKEDILWREDDLDEKALLTLLRRTYTQFKLFNGPFEWLLLNYNIQQMKSIILQGFNPLISKFRPEKADIFSSLDGIQFLPVDKNVYLRIQSFLNFTENSFEQIEFSSFLYKNYLVWSGLEQEEMRAIYRHLTTLSSSNQKGYLTGPEDIKDKDTKINAPRVFIGPSNTVYRLIIFKLLDCTSAYLVRDVTLQATFFIHLQKIIKPQIKFLGPIISEHAKKLTIDEGFRYLYFNHMNLALKTSLERDELSNDIVRVLNKMHADFERMPSLSEVILHLGTQNDGWIVGRKSDQREFYIIFDQKSANLLEINEEVKKLSSTYFKDIFID